MQLKLFGLLPYAIQRNCFDWPDFEVDVPGRNKPTEKKQIQYKFSNAGFQKSIVINIHR